MIQQSCVICMQLASSHALYMQGSKRNMGLRQSIWLWGA